MESGYSVHQASTKFEAHPRTAMRILVQKKELYDMEAQGATVGVARVLNGRYPDVEGDVLEFIRFVQNERPQFTLSLIQTRALLPIEVRQENDFKVSRGWIAKFSLYTGFNHF